jgi:methyl-accepting chemotaxis protein
MDIRRILAIAAGSTLIIAGILGLVLSIGGLLVLPRLERQVETVAFEQLEIFDRALAAMMDGLTTAQTSLGQAEEALNSLEGVTSDVGQAISDTAPVLDAATEVVGEQLPETIESTQETLTSVATSAKIVDDILAGLSTIPLLGLDRYNPEVPLHQGFQEISDGLDGIPELLLKAGEGLNAGAASLEDVEEGFAAMGQSIGEAGTSLASAQSVLDDYQGIVGDLQETLSSVGESLPGWLRTLRWSLTLVLIWLGVAQIGLMTQGADLLGRRRPSTDANPGTTDSHG